MDQKTGKYQEKKGKIILRQLKKSMLGGDTYKGLGFANLPLNTLTDELTLGATKTMALPLLGLKVIE
jgi:hypothetical protein